MSGFLIQENNFELGAGEQFGGSDKSASPARESRLLRFRREGIVYRKLWTVHRERYKDLAWRVYRECGILTVRQGRTVTFLK